jgi:hypothetical protein
MDSRDDLREFLTLPQSEHISVVIATTARSVAGDQPPPHLVRCAMDGPIRFLRHSQRVGSCVLGHLVAEQLRPAARLRARQTAEP